MNVLNNLIKLVLFLIIVTVPVTYALLISASRADEYLGELVNNENKKRYK